MVNAIYERRSIRKFLNRDVPKELILEIIDAARLAPSAKNRQPWKFIIFAGDSKNKLLGEMRKGLYREEMESASLPKSQHGIPDAKNTLRIMYEASVIIMVINTNGATPFQPLDVDERFTEICDTLSIGASIENLLLKAHELNLGTLWIANTCFAYNELSEYLDISGQLIGAIALGYSDEKPKQRPRKSLEEIIDFRY